MGGPGRSPVMGMAMAYETPESGGRDQFELSASDDSKEPSLDSQKLLLWRPKASREFWLFLSMRSLADRALSKEETVPRPAKPGTAECIWDVALPSSGTSASRLQRTAG